MSSVFMGLLDVVVHGFSHLPLAALFIQCATGVGCWISRCHHWLRPHSCSATALKGREIPGEIIYEIVQYLEPRDILTARRLSRQWNLIARRRNRVLRMDGPSDLPFAKRLLESVREDHESYLQTLTAHLRSTSQDLVILRIPYDVHESVVPSLSTLEGLEFVTALIVFRPNRPYVGDIVRPAGLPSLPLERLQRLDVISEFYLTYPPSNLFADSCYNRVTTLTLHGLEVRSSELKAILQLEQLTTLILPSLSFLGPSDGSPPNVPLTASPTLRRLALSSVLARVTLSEQHPLFDIPSLEYLEICWCPLHYYFSPNSLPNLRKLRMVEISTNVVERHNQSLLLSSLPALKSLHLTRIPWHVLDPSVVNLRVRTIRIETHESDTFPVDYFETRGHWYFERVKLYCGNDVRMPSGLDREIRVIKLAEPSKGLICW